MSSSVSVSRISNLGSCSRKKNELIVKKSRSCWTPIWIDYLAKVSNCTNSKWRLAIVFNLGLILWFISIIYLFFPAVGNIFNSFLISFNKFHFKILSNFFSKSVNNYLIILIILFPWTGISLSLNWNPSCSYRLTCTSPNDSITKESKY